MLSIGSINITQMDLFDEPKAQYSEKKEIPIQPEGSERGMVSEDVAGLRGDGKHRTRQGSRGGADSMTYPPTRSPGAPDNPG